MRIGFTLVGLTVQTKRIVVLTPEPKKELLMGGTPPPTVLTVYSRKSATQGVDSCFAYNITHLATESTIESTIEEPIFFLIDEATAAEKADDFDDIV